MEQTTTPLSEIRRLRDVTEDIAVDASGKLSASGVLSITDADQGQSVFQTTVGSAVSNLGALTLAANGAYAYSVANTAVQYLGAGNTKVDTFTVRSLDGTTKQISFTISRRQLGADRHSAVGRERRGK